jgi:tRNA G10  N-methylase Trm11
LVQDVDVNPQITIARCGGTVAIAKVLEYADHITPEYLASLIVKHAANSSITFTVSSLSQNFSISTALLGQIKKYITKPGISCRYVENKEGHTMSAIVQKGQKVTEFILAQEPEGRYIISQTVAYQDIAAWVKREYERPFVDPKRGMLPPKVARMIVNIAGSLVQTKDAHKRLLDPFCGMGTIVSEAMCLGWDTFGSDISQAVVAKAEKNIEWTKKTFLESTEAQSTIFVSGATHVSGFLGSGQIHAIVTEPFLGTPSFATQTNPDRKKIQNTIKGLEKLYIGCLKDWYSILVESGIVIMALPKIAVERHEYFVKKVIDSCEILGYSIVAGPYTYSRPKAVVSRNFYILQKISKK